MVILAAVDETERSKQVVTIANDLAVAYDDELVALHVVPEEEYESHRETLRDVPEFRDFNIEQEAESAREFARRVVDGAIDDPGVPIDARGRVGDVTDETLAAVDQLDPRYLVVGGRRRSPTGKALFGDSVQRILLNADCPVVTKLTD